MNSNWVNYHKLTKDRKPSPSLVEALNYVEKRGKALDLGAGALVESKFLLESGFQKVVAVDAVPFEPIDDPTFVFIESIFENYDFPENEFDLVNANLALPFNSPGSFNMVWGRMLDSLVPGGIFSGQLFGVNDGWSDEDSMTFHTKEQVEKMLSEVNIKVIKFDEVEKDAKTALGDSKHWHVFPIIFRKIN